MALDAYIYEDSKDKQVKKLFIRDTGIFYFLANSVREDTQKI